MFRVLGLRVEGFRVRLRCRSFRVQGSPFTVLGFKFSGSGFYRFTVSWFRVEGFRVSGAGVQGFVQISGSEFRVEDLKVAVSVEG